MRTESEKCNRVESSVLSGANSFRIEPRNSENNVDISFDFRKMEINVDVKILENLETREELGSIILKHIKKRGYSITVELTTSFMSDGGTREYFVTLEREELINLSDENLAELIDNKLNSLLDKAHKKKMNKSKLPVFS